MYIDRYLYVFIFQDTLGSILIILVIPTPISPETDVYSKIAAIFQLGELQQCDTPYNIYIYISIYIDDYIT